MRVDTAGGASGWSGDDSGQPLAPPGPAVAALEPLIGDLVGFNTVHRSAKTLDLLANRSMPVPEAESLIDIAMWDAFARQADIGMAALLGGFQERIPSYASSPVFEDPEDYLDYCDKLVAAGYRAVKFNVMSAPPFEAELARSVTSRFGGNLRFMLDLEQSYGFDDALSLGRELETMPCDWLEAPFNDSDIDAYAELNRAVGVDIIPAGNTLVDLADMVHALDAGAWARLRCDPNNCGGISQAIKAMALAGARGLKTELQSYGYPLAQAANLALMLGVRGCSYFEQPVPVEHFDYGAANPIRTDLQGNATLPNGPGLGLAIQADRIENDAFTTLDTGS
ncbi:MAG: hypothetical protein OXI95_12475 [bacterium]|nr:hypothetical protein [bacterium]